MNQVEMVSERLRERAAGMAKRSIGQPWRVRTSPNTVVEGVIVEASVAAIRNRGLSLVAQFSITMECGATKARRDFVVEKIPVR